MLTKRTIRYILGIAVAIALPLFSFLILNSKKEKGIKIPPKYRYDHIDSVESEGGKMYDTSFHKTKELTLFNQLGNEVSLNKDLRGKILLVNFMFTNCPTVCPRITSNMRMIQKAFIKKNPDIVQFISITVDPERDSVKILRNYADRFEADHDRWWMLTGESGKIFDYAQNELGLHLQPADAGRSFDHSQQFVLIDTARYIRGYFDGLNEVELKECADAIVILSREKIKKKK